MSKYPDKRSIYQTEVQPFSRSRRNESPPPSPLPEPPPSPPSLPQPKSQLLPRPPAPAQLKHDVPTTAAPSKIPYVTHIEVQRFGIRGPRPATIAENESAAQTVAPLPPPILVQMSTKYVSSEEILAKKQREKELKEREDQLQREREERKKSEKDWLWAEKYRPRKVGELVGNTKCIQKLNEWVHNRKNNPRTTKPLVALLHGPPGVGKTSTAHVVLAAAGYKITEMNASAVRTYDRALAMISDVVTRENLDGATAIVLDEIDGGSFVDKDNGIIAGLLRLLNTVKKKKKAPTWPPIICICNETGSFMHTLMNQSLVLRFHALYDSDLHVCCKRICKEENLKMSDQEMYKILKSAHGDGRRLCNLLEGYGRILASEKIDVDAYLKSSVQDLHYGLFEATKRILFNSKVSALEKQNTVMLESDAITLMIHKNAPLLFFCDWKTEAMKPVQENRETVLRGLPHARNVQSMCNFADWADVLSLTDVVERKLWKSKNEVDQSNIDVMTGLIASGAHATVDRTRAYAGGNVEFCHDYFQSRREQAANFSMIVNVKNRVVTKDKALLAYNVPVPEFWLALKVIKKNHLEHAAIADDFRKNVGEFDYQVFVPRDKSEMTVQLSKKEIFKPKENSKSPYKSKSKSPYKPKAYNNRQSSYKKDVYTYGPNKGKPKH